MSNRSDGEVGEQESTEELYKVERIVDKRFRNNGIEYLVKWFSYPESDNTWEPIDHLIEECYHLIRQFEDLNGVVGSVCPVDTKLNHLYDDSESSSSSWNTTTDESSTDSSDMDWNSDSDSETPEVDTSSVSTELASNLSTELMGESDSVLADVEDMDSKQKDRDFDSQTTQAVESDLSAENKNEELVVESEDNKSPDSEPTPVPDSEPIDPISRTGGLYPEGLIAKKITKACFDGQDIWFLIEWKNSESPTAVLAKEANIHCPQTVIQFYENRIYFD